jgi:hypothetical protein
MSPQPGVPAEEGAAVAESSTGNWTTVDGMEHL